MRISARLLVIITMFLLPVIKTGAQIIPALGCNDKEMRLQAEQLKHDFKTQGLEVYKDAMIDMESRQPTPIAVQLTKGVLYQMIFIGSKTANKITFELFDGEDNRIEERTLKHPELGNFVVYSFVPEKSDLYLVVLSQVKGTQNVCGSFSIMRQGTGKKVNSSKPQQSTTPNSNPRYVPRGNR